MWIGDCDGRGEFDLRAIRTADTNDKNVIRELVKGMLGDENADKVAELVVEDFFSNNNYRVFVIELLGIVTGFGVIKFNPFEGGSGIAEIVWLGIDKRNKRTGLGSKLVRYMEEFLKENSIRKIYVKTSVKNKDAICFWIMQSYKFEARMLDFSLKSYDDYYLAKDI